MKLAAAFVVLLTACSGGGDDTTDVVVDGGTDSGTSPTPANDAGDPAPPATASYSVTCTQASDCVLVKQATTCVTASCGCPDFAIATTDQDRYASDLTAFQTTCASRHPTQKCAADCIADTALCCANKCVAKNGTSATCN